MPGASTAPQLIPHPADHDRQDDADGEGDALPGKRLTRDRIPQPADGTHRNPAAERSSAFGAANCRHAGGSRGQEGKIGTSTSHGRMPAPASRTLWSVRAHRLTAFHARLQTHAGPSASELREPAGSTPTSRCSAKRKLPRTG